MEICEGTESRVIEEFDNLNRVPWNQVEAIRIISCGCCCCCEAPQDECVRKNDELLYSMGWQADAGGAILTRDEAKLPLREAFVRVVQWMQEHPESASPCIVMETPNCQYYTENPKSLST
ncbi:MAG: hypothetical protein DRI37_04975 [Chloroflexi bacterium]|nr:MAG: hypothetical protein DRI37_04975 [Chloroflexota bacterium]